MKELLDHFSILTTGGLVLWSKSYTPTPSPFDTLIREALIEERSSSTSSSSSISKWDRDGYSLLWTLANELELVFVVAYQRILQLSYVEELLAAVKKVFVESYEGVIKAIGDTTKGRDPGSVGLSKGERKRMFASGVEEGWKRLFKGWDEVFARILKELEASAAKNRKVSKPRAALEEVQATSDASEPATPVKGGSEPVLDAQTIAKNIAALKARQKAAGKGGKAGKGGAQSGSEVDVSDDGLTPKKKTPAKVATKWADSKVSEADMAAFDYSSDAPSSGTSTPIKSLVSSAALGTRTKSGLYEVADYDVGDSDDDDEEEDVKPAAASGPSRFSSLMAKLSLSSKSLTAADLAPVLSTMKDHLMSKNVAKDIAEKVCEGVGKSLEGRKVGSFGSVKKEVRSALEASLVKILTPKTSTDILLEIQRKKSTFVKPLAATNAKASATPYSITFVGVNGVGKSTNLSKVAFWLLQNKLRVLIAACDTFRSGAVEQLRVHVRNLGKLGEESGGVGLVQGGVQMVELYERGYGKDASGIAKDAIAYGKENGYDVVLIDTAGRMQDNEPLMRALSKLVTVNNPDKIVFVGEALVGNEAVDQLTKFNRSLRDFSGVSNARGIDGMILTKFDTIDDKVGAALSMTYVTGQPILFVGTGQTYSDLRSLRVAHIVSALLQD
ncbi:signal recognition particle binding protein [Pseudohyphozyma bogoriensis]|nr:signal recognition particle binding protein [Pseudohyphozyma bogoriensis]